MDPVPRLLILGGALLVVIGLFWQVLPFGHLPGDVVVHKKNVSFYFPIGTSLLLSIILSLIFLAFSLLRRNF